MTILRNFAGLPAPKDNSAPLPETPETRTDRALHDYSDAIGEQYAQTSRRAAQKPNKTNGSGRPPPPVDMTQLLTILRRRHPVRVKRIIRDLHWLHRKGAKYGITVVRGGRR